MSTMTIVVLILAIPLVIWAIRVDSRRWKTKSRDELLGMLVSDDWKHWTRALKELRRRGEDTSVHIPKLLPRLLADARMTREAARITLVDQFPDLGEPLSDYRATDDVERSRGKLAPLFARYGVR
jgi:hypothetical protein